MSEPVLLLTHPSCSEHDPGAGHPENPLRMQTVLAALTDAQLPNVVNEQAPLADRKQLSRVHESEYIEQIFTTAPTEGLVSLDADTFMNSASLDATRAATGAMIRGVDAVVNDQFKRVFCAVRPPGHHAEAGQAMGFCLFNGIAAAAAHALEEHHLSRVAVIDFDVHHGNGTQHIFDAQPGVLYASSHQMPLYPGTGAESETGVGNIVNLPLPPSAGSSALREGYLDTVMPAVREFQPQILLVSAGFDGHHLDPLANLNFTTDDFVWLGEQLSTLADELCDGRLVATLEGGYSPTALRECVPAFVQALGQSAC